MAEFCVDCYRKYCQPEDLTEVTVRASHEAEACEGCGQFKPVVEEAIVPEISGERLDALNDEPRTMAESFRLGLEQALFDRAAQFQEKTAVHYLTADWTSEAEKKGAEMLLNIYWKKIQSGHAERW